MYSVQYTCTRVQLYVVHTQLLEGTVHVGMKPGKFYTHGNIDHPQVHGGKPRADPMSIKFAPLMQWLHPYLHLWTYTTFKVPRTLVQSTRLHFCCSLFFLPFPFPFPRIFSPLPSPLCLPSPSPLSCPFHHLFRHFKHPQCFHTGCKFFDHCIE